MNTQLLQPPPTPTNITSSVTLTEDHYVYLAGLASDALEETPVSRNMVRRTIECEITANGELLCGSLGFSGMMYEGRQAYHIEIMLMHTDLKMYNIEGSKIPTDFNQKEFQAYIND